MYKQLINLSFITILATANSLTAQTYRYQPVVVGFYNLENLYDTINDPTKNDDEFLPESDCHYNSAVYWDKLSRLSTVLSQIGKDINPDGAALIGVAEIENSRVLTDLTKQEGLKERKLKFVHYNSPDIRGIDVALLYNPRYFSVLKSAALFVDIPSGSKDDFYTRDILYVKGILLTDTVHIFVNHWPSRRGGEERSAAARAAAALVAKVRIDSLTNRDVNVKIILMGDLNDDPVSPSVTKVLKAKGKPEAVTAPELFNPWVDFYKRGLGTLAYRDSWGLFDQIIVSAGLLNKDQKGLFYNQAYIFKREFMIQRTGKYKGYAKRTFDGNTYNYGFSDHFPTYISLLRRVD